MDTNPEGVLVDHHDDGDHLVSPVLFWVLLTTLATFYGVILAIALLQ